MERFMRLVFLTLFVIGFVGAVAGAVRTSPAASADSSTVSLIRDVRLAQEANAINSGKWSPESAEIIDTNSDTLTQVERLFSKN